MNRKLRILSSDDDAGIRALLFHLLAEQGHEVEFAKGSDDVFRNLGRAKYDLLILDVNMPGMNGYKVAEKICANIINRPRILIFTAREIKDEQAQFKLCGADAIIGKGAPCEKIMSAINELFAGSEAAKAAGSRTSPAGQGAKKTPMQETKAQLDPARANDKLKEDLQLCLFKITLMEDTINLKNMRYEGFIRDLLKEKQSTEKNYLEFKRIEAEVVGLRNWAYAAAAVTVLCFIRSFF